MEDEDKKTETNLEIWKKHQEKEGKGLKKIFIFIFFSSCIILHSKIGLVTINYLTQPRFKKISSKTKTLYQRLYVNSDVSKLIFNLYKSA